jgi:hypothetical protein
VGDPDGSLLASGNTLSTAVAEALVDRDNGADHLLILEFVAGGLACGGRLRDTEASHEPGLDALI